MDKVKILVVDDESRMRKLVRDFLTRQNYEVLEAADGEEALDIFYKDKAIALLILDVMMPKMNGWEVCREIRHRKFLWRVSKRFCAGPIRSAMRPILRRQERLFWIRRRTR